MVEEVEELCSDLQLHDFRVRNWNHLESTEVHIGVRRTDETVATLLTEVSWGGKRTNEVALVRYAAVRKKNVRAATAVVVEAIVELVSIQNHCAIGESGIERFVCCWISVRSSNTADGLRY